MSALTDAALDEMERLDWRKPLSDDGVEFVRRRVEAFWREPITPRLELERVPMTFVSALLARLDGHEAPAADNRRDAWAALALIREAIETLGPVGVLPSEEAVPKIFGVPIDRITDGFRMDVTFDSKGDAHTTIISEGTRPAHGHFLDEGAALVEGIRRIAQERDAAREALLAIDDILDDETLALHTAWDRMMALTCRALHALPPPATSAPEVG